MSEEHGKLVSLGELSESWRVYEAQGGKLGFHEWLQAQGYTLANANEAYLPARHALFGEPVVAVRGAAVEIVPEGERATEPDAVTKSRRK